MVATYSRGTKTKKIINSGAAIIRNTQRMCYLNLLVFVEAVFERPLTDNESTFEDLLKKDNSVSMHHENIRLLGREMYKVKNNLSTYLMSEIFILRNIDYNLRSQTDFKQGPVNTVNYGLKSLRYLVLKIWNIIPLAIRSSGSLTEFIASIKSWVP